MSIRADLWQFIARNRDHTVLAAAARAAQGYLMAWQARANYRIESDGEERVLRLLGHGRNVVLFDVGANRGEWSIAADRFFPGATFFAFEPVESTLEMLTTALKPLGTRGRVVGLGLAATTGERQCFVPAPGSALSSTIKAPEGSTVETIRVTTIDAFCAAEALSEIEVLKIDTEGLDHEVIQGATRLLMSRKVRLVQFEYGPWAIETRFLLKDFYSTFARYNYVVGKVYPRSVEFGEWNPELEDFRGLNFVAVRAEDRDLVETLSIPSD